MADITTRAGKGSPLENDEVDANFTNLNDDKLEATDLSVSTGAASGGGALSYASGVFAFTPAVTGIENLDDFTTTDLVEGSNLYYTEERVDDRVNALIVPGLGITTDYDDTAGTLTVESDTIEELCKNGTGSTILKGTPVYQTGTAGNFMEIAPADASSAATMPAVGVLGEDLTAGAEGTLLLMGRISGVDTSAFGEGDVIYVASGGGYTNTRPTGESVLVQNLGRVTKVNATNGGGVVMGSGRANDVPNLTDGNIFIGNASGTYDKRAIVAADISDLTATATELNYTDGVTSSIQTQLNSKLPSSSYTASDVLTKIKTVDGSGSGLDSDLLDGQQGSYYTGYTDTAIANLVDSAPATLDTLNELAAALGDDPNFATTVTNSIATKAPLASPTFTGTVISNELKADNGNLILGDTAYSASASYIGMKTSYQSGTNDYMIISGISDGDTYISAKDGSAVNIRGGGNYAANEIRVPDTGAPTIGGSTIWHAGNDGTGSGLDADLLDGQQGSYYYPASNPNGYTTNVGDITGVTAGVGLSGGGASGTVTLTVDLSELTDMTAAMVGTDEFIVLDASSDRRKAANEIGLSIFNNDAGFTTNVGDITGVTAGSYLAGGGTSGTVTLAVDATAGNNASKVVARDASGNFAAGTITANLTGTASNADTLDGFNSSQGESANTVAVRSSAGYLLASYFNGSGTFATTGATSGMARFTGTNGTDTYGRSYTAQAAATLLSGSTMNIAGNATTATTLQTARNIALTGAVTGNANFNGGGNISITTTATADPTLTLAGDATGSATFTNLGNATLTVAVADDSHNHTRLIAIDDRDMKPNTSGVGSTVKGIKAFFTSLGGMTGTANTDYQDVLVLDTYSDTSGGNATALSFDKSNGAMRIWSSSQTATTWGTSQRVFADNYHPNADTLTTARTINGVSFNGSANITVADATKLPLTGGTISGSLTIGAGVTLAESTDRPDLLQITSTTSTWGGLQIRNSSNEGRWSFMTDGEIAGIYNDEDEQWHIYMSEAAGVNLYYAAAEKIRTTAAGVTITGTATATTFSGALSGNATTATTLQTARTINGVSFNGSANITVADATKLPLTGGTLSGNLSVSGDTFFGYGTLTADSQNDVVLFSADGNTAQSGAFHNKLIIKGGSSQSRDLQLYQQDGGYSWLDTSWTGNSLNISSNFTALNVNTTLNIDGNLNAVDNIYLAGSLYHEGDTDTRLLFGTNTITLQTAGSSEITVNSLGVRLGDTGNGYFQPVTGSYGSVQIDGGAHGGYEGYSIGARVVFMHNNANAAGIYNDVDNEWMIETALNGAVSLYYNGASKIQTTNTGANVTGTMNATAFTGDGSGLTGIASLPSQTGNAGEFLTTDGTNASWLEISASAKVNATADGSLADGDKVIIQSDGTVKKVTQTTAGSDMSITTGVQFVAATTEIILSIDTKPDDDTVFAFTTQSGKLFMCKNTSGTLSVLASTTATAANRYLYGAFNPTHPDNFVTIEVYSKYIRNKVFVLNPSAPSITSVGNLQTGGQVADGYADVFMDGSTFYTLGKNTSSVPSILSASFSSANTATNSWTVTPITNNAAWYRRNMAVNNGVTLACTATVNYSYLTGNNGTNNDVWLYQPVENVIIRPCIGQAGKFIMTYRGGINYYIRIAIVVSGRVNLGEPVLVPDAFSFSGLFVDEDTPTKAVVSYSNKLPGIGGAYRTLTINYTTNTIEMSEAFTTDSNHSNAITYSGASGEFYTVTSDGTDMDGQILTREVLAVTNLTDDNFLGISDGVYSDTDTAGIQVISAIDDAQSGLTTGLKYYVQPDNTLATTPSNPEVYAGIAISATELLIKG